jgi:hypothetical protein
LKDLQKEYHTYKSEKTIELSMTKFKNAQDSFKLNSDFKALQTKYDEIVKEKEDLLAKLK